MFVQTEVRTDMFLQTIQIANVSKKFFASNHDKTIFRNSLGQGESIDTLETKIHQEMGELEVFSHIASEIGKL